jgi:hypothetical protein
MTLVLLFGCWDNISGRRRCIGRPMDTVHLPLNPKPHHGG